MRLGELRTMTRDCDNRLRIMLSVYDDVEGTSVHELELDMLSDNDLFFRLKK